MDKGIVLVTSIAPKNIENQQAAIGSWIKTGFRIISCNIQEELEEIRDLFPGVEFVEVTRDAREQIQKPCPYIYDMLQILKEHASEVCGIVNSDIYLQNFTDEMYQFIKENAQDSVVFCRRQEVPGKEEMKQLDSEVYFGGIDTFFFPKTAIDIIPDDGLILGQAVWDYWFPIVLHKKGMMLKEFVNPITFHITHLLQWTHGITDRISASICENHFKEVKPEDATFFLQERYYTVITGAEDICYVPEQLARKKVLVVNKDGCGSDGIEMMKGQTHANILTLNEMQMSQEMEGYDYVIKIPFYVCPRKTFISAAIWIMETYRIQAMRAHLYLRGNVSGEMLFGNCNSELLHSFNEELEPLGIYTRRAFQEESAGRKISLKYCKVPICGVWTEERAEVLFPRQAIEGRVLLFPAGFAAKMWIRKYRNCGESIEVKGFVDNDFSRAGTQLEGLPIYDINILKEQEQYDKVLIVSNLYTGQIYEQLKEIVPVEKIAIWKNELDVEEWKQLGESAWKKKTLA